MPSVNSSIQSLTNNATMIYLAHVAGKVSQIDNNKEFFVKNLHAERLSKLEKSTPIPTSSSLSISNTNSQNNSNTNLNNNNTTSSNNQTPNSVDDTEPILDSFGHGNSLNPILNNNRFTIPPLTTTQSMRQKPSTNLTDIEYIISSNASDEIKSQYILTDIEATKLIKLFFITLHPFYPYIPKDLRDPNILANYPILLCALLAISARYHPLPEKIGDWDNNDNDQNEIDNNKNDNNNNNDDDDSNNNKNLNDRHLSVHEQLWIYCQRLMSMTVWGESSSRSVGTLLTFLLFTEWNPRAIHFRWGDYANSSYDDSLANKKIKITKNVGKDNTNNNNNNNSKSNNSRKSSEINLGNESRNNSNNNNTNTAHPREHDEEEEFVGLSAMKRSEIMSFMLIGTATRLSFLLDTDPLIFIATHVSEINIAVGLNKKSMLQQTLSEVDVKEPLLQFTLYQKAKIELLQFFSLCYETLYGTRPKFISLDKYQTLAILDILSPILENWYRKYFKLLKPSNIHCAQLTNCNDDTNPNWLQLINKNVKLERDLTISIERESLILDYYYTKLYLYSLALSGDTSVNLSLRNSKKGKNLRLDELARYSRYVELAYKAAKEVLAVIQRVRKLKLLKFMPVRWVTKVIKSVSFIVKCYLTLTTDININNGNNNANPNNPNSNMNTNGEILKLSVIPLEEIITLLQKTAICLRYAAPDELHLCTRYSTILMYLCSQFKTQLREHNDKFKNGIREYEKDVELNYYENDNENENEEMEMEGTSTQQQQQQQYNENFNPNTIHSNAIPNNAMPVNISMNNETIKNQLHTDNIFENKNLPQFQIFDQNPMTPLNPISVNENYPPPNSNFVNNDDIENINFSNANQQLFDDFFNKNPSEKLFNFFSTNDNNPGLDFVDQFTKEIEKDFLSKGGKH